jgi:uncharacterized membrane protein YqjE
MAEFSSGQAGIFTSIKRMATNFVGILETRGELFVTELHEEKLRIMLMLIWTVVAVVLGAMGLTLLTLLLLFVFWDSQEHRITVLAILAGLYFIGAIVAACFLRKLFGGSAKPFEETLNQLKKDRECLKK